MATFREVPVFRTHRWPKTGTTHQGFKLGTHIKLARATLCGSGEFGASCQCEALQLKTEFVLAEI